MHPNALLDAIGPVRDSPSDQRSAVVLLQARAMIPGIPHPSRDTYDRLYGEADVVITRPLAMARVFAGPCSVELAGSKLTPRWAIVRDLDCLEIVGKRPARVVEIEQAAAHRTTSLAADTGFDL